MCFPDGYTDVYGKKHLGPHCLKRDGVGQTVPPAAHGIQGEPGHKAFEKSAGVDLQKLAQLTKKLRLLFGRDGWKDHAAGDSPFDTVERFRYTPHLEFCRHRCGYHASNSSDY